jgi:hypothetical protein
MGRRSFDIDECLICYSTAPIDEEIYRKSARPWEDKPLSGPLWSVLLGLDSQAHAQNCNSQMGTQARTPRHSPLDRSV